MRARKARPIQPVLSDRRLRNELEADVFEIWIGVSPLMSRLRDPSAPFKDDNPPTRRRRTAGERG